MSGSPRSLNDHAPPTFDTSCQKHEWLKKVTGDAGSRPDTERQLRRPTPNSAEARIELGSLFAVERYFSGAEAEYRADRRKNEEIKGL